ncbi:MAG: class I SAM-dependent methyltransferase [Candidatus Omnitrophica bacterium]|nr:class I SAM-dependent methyltransferase [Candidatus Omnitrophota bacterium]
MVSVTVFKDMIKSPETDLSKICERAMDIGMELDLSDCPYGETTGPCSFIKRPTSYYFFLAGFVSLLRLKSILEIGTNYGGSIMAISKGLHPDDIKESRLVTIDIIRKNEEGFKGYPHIRRIEGDSLDGEVARRVINSFDKEVDLIYLDAVHEYEHTKRNLDIYADKLNPRYVVLDDIRQCDEMRRLWGELKCEFGDRAFDASDITIRKGAGFGVIKRK